MVPIRGNFLRRTKLFVALTTALSLAAFSGIALAEHEEGHDEDTLFSFGYDEENHVLAVNEGPNDGLYVCHFENGALTAQYGDANDEGVIAVESLEDDDGTKEFNPRLQHELADGLTQASEPIAYAGPDGECQVNGVVVAGPNGQINHGQFMKAFKSLTKMKGHGCLNRYLAQSDLGKTEATKVRTEDADPDHEVGESGDITFVTFEADCVHGKKDKSESDELEESGKSKKPKKNDKGNRGKSAQAPGQNK